MPLSVSEIGFGGEWLERHEENKLYDLAVMQPEVPESLKQHYLALEHHALECIGCRACESRCPFGVKVAGRMIRTAGLFGC